MKILEPILVILGSTGSGKSKLGIELAIKYKGEVINADAMQVTLETSHNIIFKIFYSLK